MGRPPLPLGSWGKITSTRRSSGSFQAFARYRDRDGTTRRVRASGPTRAAAEKAVRELMTERVRPSDGEISGSTTVQDLADYWLAHLKAEGRVEQSTLAEYGRVVDRIVVPELGGIRLRELRTSRLDRLLLELRAVSINRQRKTKVVLGNMLDLAVRHDALAINPIRNVGRVHRVRPEPRALTAADLVAVRAAIQGWESKQRPGPRTSSDLRDLIELLIATGLRVGEGLALRWSDLNLDSPTPTLTVNGTIKTDPGRGTYRKPSPKTDAGHRTIVLPPTAVVRLTRRRDHEPPNDLGAVFVTRNGSWHQVSNVERRWRSIRAGTTIEWATTHSFRRTVATLISEQLGAEQAARQLGHSSPDITREHYIARPAISADHSAILEQLIKASSND